MFVSIDFIRLSLKSTNKMVEFRNIYIHTYTYIFISRIKNKNKISVQKCFEVFNLIVNCFIVPGGW